ncbi:cation:proton antiporter domain-containing protein [Coprobacter tertius]
MSIESILPTLPLTNPVLIFFIVLTIILFAPIILNRFRIPHIIGLIIAGIIVGPYGLGWLDRDSSFHIFGNVGLLYLMFLAGLEMDINDFKKNKTQGIVFGLYTFFVPMILGTVISYYTLHFDLRTSILLASMYASHTLVAYPIVSRYGVSRSTSVTTTISGTIITVLGALIILAAIAGMAQGNIDNFFWLRLTLSVAAYTAAIIYVYPRLTRWFLKKYSDNVTQYIFVLALVFAASFLAQLVGLEAIIGAFFAGVILNRFIPAVSPLMNRIEFVGNALFIPYFLIGVGMLINLREVFSSIDAMIVAINMSVVATVAKWIAAWFTQKTFKLSKIDRNMIFGLSNAQAAATLAAVLIGHDLGIFDSNVLNGTIVMILVTCTISSFVTEKAARKLATQQMLDDNDEKLDIGEERILIPVANPSTIENLINIALLLKNPKKKSELFAIHVTDDQKTGDGPGFKARNALSTAAKVASSADTRLNPIYRYDINIASGIIHAIRERNISEVVIGLHHKANIVDSFFGNKTELLLKGTNKMIFISKIIIPVSTITRIVIAVPEKAEYETGFVKWIDRIANMAKQIGCRAIFYAHPQTITQIKAVLKKGNYRIRNEFEILENWEDILMLTGVVLQDDLFIIVSARRTSVSHSPEFDKLPVLLSRYFAGNNLVVLYPEQFGKEREVSFFSDPLSIDVQRHYTHIFGLKSLWEKFRLRNQKMWKHLNRKESK